MAKQTTAPAPAPAPQQPAPAPAVLPKPTLPNPSEGIKTGGKPIETR